MIFYFSATGNCQHVAARLADALGGSTISIGVALRDEHYAFNVAEDEYIGFVIPTFAGTIPAAAARFIEQLDLTGADGKYVFAVYTCGGGAGETSAALRTAIESRGLTYSGAFGLTMIDNYIPWSSLPSDASIRSRLDAADAKLDAFIKTIRAKTPGDLPSRPPQNKFMAPLHLDSASGSCEFTLSDACDGCGLCAELCPMRCIEISDGKPAWRGDCTICFACLHRCPKTAIDFGRETVGKTRYHHPDTEPVTQNKY